MDVREIEKFYSEIGLGSESARTEFLAGLADQTQSVLNLITYSVEGTTQDAVQDAQLD